MPTLKPILPCKSSPDSIWLQYQRLCQYTCSIPDCVVCTVCVVCTHVLYTEWLYSCLLSESSNYKLGRLDIKNLLRTHWLTDSPTPLLEPPAVQAPPGLKMSEFWKKKKPLIWSYSLWIYLNMPSQIQKCLNMGEGGSGLIENVFNFFVFCFLCLP